MWFSAKGAVLFTLSCLAVVPGGLAQESQHKTGPGSLNRREGSAIVRAALHSRHHEADCSHLVHTLYERAGFPYEYAPSSDLYAGIDEFQRVANPQPGDLTVWRGHAGIVVNPAQHSFFSMLSSGPGVDSWDSPYWKQWGRPRFFRYLKQPPSGSGSIRTTTPKP
jgi:NlpC/P60 family protein